MFKDTKEENKYEYKDIKLILGFKTKSGLILFVEVQLILKSILSLKKVLHKFYEVTRTSGGSLTTNL